MDSPFTNISHEETISICTESIYDQSNSVDGLSKSEFKELLSLATKESYFNFDEFFEFKLKIFKLDLSSKS